MAFQVKRGSRSILKIIFLSSLLLAAAPKQAAAISINLNFLGGLTASQQTIFGLAESFWEGVLIGYKPGISLTGVTIDAEGATIDGVGGTLGSAGPNFVTQQAGTWLTTSGSMTFDSADLANMETNGILDEVIVHEMAHVLGFGTLWSPTWNNLSVSGSGAYTGAFGLAAYQAEFDPLATFVPVELAGGAGTANGHWNENTNGAGLTGITDSLGRDMRDEIMTGWLNPNSFVSNTTKQSFQDLGFEVAATVPVPAAVWLFASGLGMLFAGSTSKHRRPQ